MSSIDFCDEVIAWCTRAAQDIPKYKRELKQLKRDTVKGIVKNIKVKYSIKQKELYEAAFKEAVDMFYDDYSPNRYRRNFSLYKAIDIKMNTGDGTLYGTRDDMSMDLSQVASFYSYDKVTEPRNGSQEYLFKLTFVEGWHGGAKTINEEAAETWGYHPNPGTPYYRTGGFVTYPSGITKPHRYAKWLRAHCAERMDPSPEKYFKSRIADLDNPVDGELTVYGVKLIAGEVKSARPEYRKAKKSLQLQYFWPSWIDNL